MGWELVNPLYRRQFKWVSDWLTLCIVDGLKLVGDWLTLCIVDSLKWIGDWLTLCIVDGSNGLVIGLPFVSSIVWSQLVIG